MFNSLFRRQTLTVRILLGMFVVSYVFGSGAGIFPFSASADDSSAGSHSMAISDGNHDQGNGTQDSGDVSGSQNDGGTFTAQHGEDKEDIDGNGGGHDHGHDHGHDTDCDSADSNDSSDSLHHDSNIGSSHDSGDDHDDDSDCPTATSTTATFTVKKHVVNDNGGTLYASAFFVHVTKSGTDVASSPAAGSETGTVYTLQAGTYSVSEDVNNSYSLIGVTGDCDSHGMITLLAGEHKSCTLTNNDNPPVIVTATSTLHVKVNVIENTDDTAQSSDFNVTVSGAHALPSFFPGNALGTSVTIDANASYTVAIAPVTGFTATLSADCSGTILAAGSATCVVTEKNNDDVPLVVVDQVINTHGGSLTPADFAVTVAGASALPSAFAGNASGTTVLVDAGHYFSVSEATRAGYSTTFSSGCSGTISLNGSGACTITNTDDGFGANATSGIVNVIVTTTNDNGGVQTSSDFVVTVADSSAASTTFHGNASGTATIVAPGTYSVTEATSSLYATTFSADCAGTVAAGQTNTCTIANDDIAAVNNGTSTLAITPATLPDGVTGTVYSEMLTATGGATGTYAWSVATGTVPTGLTLDASSTGATTTISGTPTASGTYAFTAQVVNGSSTATQSYTVTITDPTPTGCTSNCGGGGGGGTGCTSNCGGGGGGGGFYYSYDLKINGGAPTTATTSVTLNLIATGATSVVISNDQNFTTSTTDSFSSTHPWVLTDGVGTKTVYVKYLSGTTVLATVFAHINLVSGGQVLGAESPCGIYMTKYIRLGRKNDPSEVRKLQIFLNKQMGLNLAVTGFYGTATEKAVEAFQVKYGGTVLAPWVPFGLQSSTTPTGYVYKTTLRWINLLACDTLDLPMPQLP